MEPRTVRLLTNDECKRWLAARNYADSIDAHFPIKFTLPTPAESGVQCGLVGSMLTWIPIDKTALLHVTAWGIWSRENPALFQYLRESVCGRSEPLIKFPGQIMELSDRQALESALEICLYNLWDATLVDELQRCYIQFSHDEFVTCACALNLEDVAMHTLRIFGGEEKGNQGQEEEKKEEKGSGVVDWKEEKGSGVVD